MNLIKPTSGASNTTPKIQPVFGDFTQHQNASIFGVSQPQNNSSSLYIQPATSAFSSLVKPAVLGIFEQNAPQPSTSLFGQPTTSTNTSGVRALGQSAPQPSTFLFGQPAPSASTSGQSAPQPSTSLFSQPATSTRTSGFRTLGQSALQASTSLCGQPASSTSTSDCRTLGQTAPTSTSFYPSAFSQPTNAAITVHPGTSIAKYQPTDDTDTIKKDDEQSNTVNVKLQTITAMKQYEGKSLEELRMEDYLANRRDPQNGSASCFSVFGAPTQQFIHTGLFKATDQPFTGLFDQPAAGTTCGKPVICGFSSTVAQPFDFKSSWEKEALDTDIPMNQVGLNSAGTIHCISAMNEYDEKSLEEIRMNDYLANRKGIQTESASRFGSVIQPATGTGLFGAPALLTNTGFGTAAGQQQQPYQNIVIKNYIQCAMYVL